MALFFGCGQWCSYCNITSNIQDFSTLKFHIYTPTIFFLTNLSFLNALKFLQFYQQLYTRDAQGFQWYHRQWKTDNTQKTEIEHCNVPKKSNWCLK